MATVRVTKPGHSRWLRTAPHAMGLAIVYLDLRDVHDRPLVLAMKLVANGPLIDRFRTVEGLPQALRAEDRAPEARR